MQVCQRKIEVRSALIKTEKGTISPRVRIKGHEKEEKRRRKEN